MISNSTLTDIKFTRTYPLSDNEVDRLCKGCPYLTRLSLGFSNPLSDASVRSIVKYCPGIEYLSLSWWYSITDDSMIALAALSSLKEIDLSDCSGLSSAGVQNLLRSSGASLEVLTLWSGDDYFECKFCDDAFLRCLGTYCPKLRDICVCVGTLSNDTAVAQASLLAFVRGCTLLKNLRVYSEKITDEFWVELADNCPCLSRLDLTYANITDVGFNAITSASN